MVSRRGTSPILTTWSRPMCSRPPRRTCAGQVLNIACGTSVSVNEIIRHINALLGTDCRPRYEPERPGDVKHSLADISEARRWIGYAPRVMFDEGLRRAIEYYKAGQ